MNSIEYTLITDFAKVFLYILFVFVFANILGLRKEQTRIACAQYVADMIGIVKVSFQDSSVGTFSKKML